MIGFCFECSIFVCVNCLLGSHDIHKQKVSSLEESVLKRRSEVLEIGVGLEKRLEIIESKSKTVEQEIKRLEENLKRKRIAKKNLDLEKSDLKMRQDIIVRLSETPTCESIFDEEVFSMLLQTANNLLEEINTPFSNRGVIGSERIRFVSSVPCDSKPWGMVEDREGGGFIVAHDGGVLTVRDKEGALVQTFQFNGGFIDVAIGLNDQIVGLNQPSSQIMILDKEGHLIRSFGSAGSQPGQFNKPCGLTVDGEGRIIVADTHNDRIQVFNDDGSFIRCFGSSGSSEGHFCRPHGVAVDEDGNLVILDCLNHRIQVIGIEGNFVRTFGTKGSKCSQMVCPEGVVVDGKGRILVAETGRVSVFEKNGAFVRSFGSGQMKEPFGIAVHSSGAILISEQFQKTLQLWK